MFNIQQTIKKQVLVVAQENGMIFQASSSLLSDEVMQV